MRREFFSYAVVVSLISTAASLFAQAPQSPGKEHEELKAQEGVWDAALKMADGSEVKGESEFKMTCEGMWLASDFRADTTQDSSDKMSFQMFTTTDGKDVEVMSITYTRRKR